ncbi:MAG: hypothetical protein JNL32_09890 [Candidatus Kapabacteria bacterium]|nr:hypothetical protein [Candidatus Kapabacteria bacterium]
MNHNEPLSTKRIFSFWYPLALTWAMMALEGPVLNAVVSRMAEQKANLAAYSTAVSLAMIIESPIIMILSATVALVKGRASYYALRRYMIMLMVLVTVIMLIVLIPPVFDVITLRILSVPQEIASLLYKGLLCLVLWSPSIGYRRFYQGLMIKKGKTRLVAIGTIFRMMTMAVSAYLFYSYSGYDGVVVGSLALNLGVVFEAVATRFMARDVVRDYENDTTPDEAPSVSRINTFYIPLALTSIMGMAVNPMLIFFMGLFPFTIESLAVFQVIDSFVFQFRSPGFSYQETVLALLGAGNKHYEAIKRFGLLIMGMTVSLLAIVAFSPLLTYVYSKYPYGLSGELTSFAITPTQILVLLPALSVLYSLQRGVLINSHRTKQVTLSTLFEVASIAVSLGLIWGIAPGLTGATAAAIAMIAGRIIANVYLWIESRKSLNED